MIWNNREYISKRPVAECPVDDWPYVTDALVAVGAFTAASLIQSNTVKIDRNPVIVSAPLFVFGSVLVVSSIGGAGEVVGCNRLGYHNK